MSKLRADITWKHRNNFNSSVTPITIINDVNNSKKNEEINLEIQENLEENLENENETEENEVEENDNAYPPIPGINPKIKKKIFFFKFKLHDHMTHNL